jgi:polar amino acid transport system substrate-binding protein
MLQFHFFFALLISFTASTNVHAADLIPLTAAADPWPPYIDDTVDGGGVSVELADAAFRTQGYTVTNRIVPWARAMEEVKHGRVDLILDAWWTQERSNDYMFSRPYLDGPLKFIKKRTDKFTFNNHTSLRNKSLALVRDYGYGDALLSSKEYRPVEVTDFILGIRMLEAGRVDLAIENELVARTRLAKESPSSLEKLAFVEPAISNNYVYVMSGYKNPQHAKIIAAFNQGLMEITANGTFEKIVKKHHLTMPTMLTTNQ